MKPMKMHAFMSAGLVALLVTRSALGAVDLSSPRSAARSFYEAMNNADNTAMRDCLLVEGEDQQQLANAFLDLVVASKKLSDAAREKFGAGADKQIAAGAISREDAAA